MAETKEKTPKEVAKASPIGQAKKENFGIKLEEMASAGLHFGHRPSKTHPKMKPYIYGIRNDVHIIDLEKTTEKLKKALEFIKKLISDNKTLLLVGTKIQIKNLVKDIAKEANIPYINERWLGGTFTNFETIKKRIAYFKELEEKKATGKFEKYTKKEKAKIDKKLMELEIKFGGIKELEKLPEAVFVSDMKKDVSAIKEAIIKGITVVAISDTDTDPSLVNYPIPVNDDAISSVKYILEKVREVILKTKAR